MAPHNFKPWRKGKSKNATAAKKGSLKHQLRGLERLLSKHQDDTARKQELEAQIEALRRQTKQRDEVAQQRDNAKRSHGRRFMERQKLVRMERTTRKLLRSKKLQPEKRERYQNDLYKIALDQVYVAHFPHDMRYMPLFRNNTRLVDGRRYLNKRAQIRAQILSTMDKTRKDTNWISQSQYGLVPSTWSFDQEKDTFGMLGKKPKNEKTENSDSRFSLSATQEKLLETAIDVEAELDKEESINVAADKNTTAGSGSPDRPRALPSAKGNSTSDSSDSSDSSDDSSSSSSDDDVPEHESSEKDGVSDKDAPKITDVVQGDDDDSSDEDDFLLPAAAAGDAFASAKEDRTEDFASGDKSQGWKTQRQRPGEFKRKRRRL